MRVANIRHVTTTSPAASTGSYPIGFAGYRREWDGQAWTDRVTADPAAPDLHEHHAFVRIFTHASVYALIVAVVIGFVVVSFGVTLDSAPLLALGGAFATGGPVIALVLAVRRRLRIRTLRTWPALVLGIAWGLAAFVVAFVVELLVERSGNRSETRFAFDGLVEEPIKLLLPVVLLATGPALFKNPRVGVWMVVIASAVFGIGEGAVYLSGLATTPTAGETAAQLDAQVTAETGRLLFERMWVEIAHVIWTGGAAALIWLGAHRAGRAFSWLGVLGLAIAVALHLVNDAVLPVVEAALLGGSPILGLIWVVLGYYLWFRPRMRQLVPPEAVVLVPKRWRPRVSRAARHHASAAAPVAAGSSSSTESVAT
jgi:hypothetical protein